MFRWRKLAATVAPVTLLACSQAGTVLGKVHGQPLNTVDAMALTGDQLSPGEDGAGLYLINTPGLCGLYQSGTSPNDATALVIALAETDASGKRVPPTPGDYLIVQQTGSSLPPSARIAVASFKQDDASCTGTVAEPATSGTVHVSSFSTASGGSLAGSLDLLFGSDRLSGTFDAPYCSGQFPAAATCQSAPGVDAGTAGAPVP